MGNQTDYFERIGYRGEYEIGDRVIGTFDKTPFVGTVGNDRLINHTIGPEITIHLDLPMLVDNVLKNVIIVKHKDIRRLKTIDLKEPK